MISRSRVAPSEFPDHNINAVNNHTNARHSVTFCGINGASSTSFHRSNGSARESFTGASAGATQDEDFSACIEWFRQNLAKVAKHGRVTLKDFKHAARVLDVSPTHKLRPHLIEEAIRCTLSVGEYSVFCHTHRIVPYYCDQ